MPVYQIDPLSDLRWRDLTERHPYASVFHSAGWLRALQQSYGYRLVAYTLSPPGSELTSGIVFANIRSWVTGRRLVSLPFSDHCEPLIDCKAHGIAIFNYVCQEAAKNRERFVEVRPLGSDFEMLRSDIGFEASEAFVSHSIDLRPALNDLFRKLHKDCIQRKVRRAEKEHLAYREGRSEELLRMFFDLQLKTRRKHELPPQPIAWFRNLVRCLGENIQIHVALKEDRPVAAIMTASWNKTLVYKYGCSDPEFSNLGGTPMLFWKAIDAAKRAGLTLLDLGRSDVGNAGLLTFKDHLGGDRRTLRYWRQPGPEPSTQPRWNRRAAGYIFRRLPDNLLTMTGSLLYKHMG